MGDFNGMMWGVVVWILPQIGRVLSNRHKVFESTASASVASILRKSAKDGARSADANIYQGLCGWLRMSGHR
ncbi:MAG TPA: hypothetical protein VE054_12650, partial [Blattabacteriaceae bacterium]|nr:hypothetical protein [Blattabacteriaceae bacterium]